MAMFVSEAFEELKKQVESLGLDEKSKSKFLMEEWRKVRETEAEENRAERETAAEERRLQAEREAAAEERRLQAKREAVAEEKRAEREAEEKRAECEAEERKLLAKREAEERKTAMEFGMAETGVRSQDAANCSSTRGDCRRSGTAKC